MSTENRNFLICTVVFLDCSCMDRAGDFRYTDFQTDKWEQVSEAYRLRRRMDMNTEDFTVYRKVVPEGKPEYREFPPSLHPDIRNDLTVEVEFPGYGRKQFLKALGEVEFLPETTEESHGG